MENMVHGPAFEGGAGFQPVKQGGEGDSERRSSVIKSMELAKI